MAVVELALEKCGDVKRRLNYEVYLVPLAANSKCSRYDLHLREEETRFAMRLREECPDSIVL